MNHFLIEFFIENKVNFTKIYHKDFVSLYLKDDNIHIELKKDIKVEILAF